MGINRLCGQPGSLMPHGQVAQWYGIDMMPCPFCGGLPALHLGRTPHATCAACAADGPPVEVTSRVDRDEAAAQAARLWNMRAAGPEKST